MEVGTFIKPGLIVAKDYPKLKSPADALLKIVRTSVCGSDLW